ncbi:HDOD domain-containing protein [Endozoicomonas sp. SM1973]|uniref:HDOD domain-containing protein n=1 Tax=Spartinivicinus marinus TaxID=2994442 RepID=A0A853I308_9GAMM|nr:HDOD domain-containing protein [Spartinivicinus marinus]MCX4029154.1 HDOD domain-containing protein [Spartinivicinus marinus]NYZ67773.1 HDOD domain-containing protein [Spartinivicinus marinus]
MTEIAALLARQPIVDQSKKLQGYELLFRSDTPDALQAADGDRVTSELLDNVFSAFDLDELVGDNPAYINCTRNLLLQKTLINPDRFVLEVLEDVKLDKELLVCLKKLRDEGFTIALDDFELDSQTIKAIPFVDIIKIDVLQHNKEEIASLFNTLKQHKVKLLAEKVENYQMFEYCKQLGFELFQGYFLCKPEVLSGKKMESNKLVVMELVTKLQNPEIDFDDLAGIIDKDPSIAYKLLKLVNSSFYHRGKNVESIRQAITILGLTQVRNLVTILMLSKLTDKPNELTITALVRAMMCQLLAKNTTGTDPGGSFLVGLLSTLDAFMDQPLDALIDSMPVPDSYKEAIINFNGLMGTILINTMLYEQGAWQKINWNQLSEHNITDYAMRDAYCNSLKAAQALQNL